MKEELREEAIRLRKQERLSYSEIKERLDVAKSTLSYWLRDYPLSEEEIRKRQKEGWKKAQASRERYRNTMREKKEKKKQKIYERYKEKFAELSKREFLIAGLMLYLGEGTKKKRATVSIINTDPSILNFFIAWMEKFLDADKNEIKVHLHLYENMNIEKEKEYWKENLGIEESQLYKPSIRSVKDGSFSYDDTSRHGTCALYFYGAEERRNVIMGMKALVNQQLE
jgi:transposase-like protein